MSARREQNGDVESVATENETETDTETANRNVNVSETDFMLKIMTATPTSAAATTTVTLLTTVNAQNKCASAAPTTFSYQRAAKRCARLEETTTATATSTATIEATNEATTATNPCESQRRRLAEHKAQLRAAFFKDFNKLAAQHQQQQQQPEQQPQQLSEEQQAIDSTHTRIQQLIEKFQTMIVQQQTQSPQQQTGAEQTQQLKPQTTTAINSAANSDEGCNAGGLSPCSSDNECDATIGRRKPKVTRCASSDSALGLEVDDVNMDVMPVAPPQRRMTLTVTDLPLRPALLPLAEPTALPDSPLTSPTNSTAATAISTTAAGSMVSLPGSGGVPSKVLLEERVVAALSAPSSSRRESTQSCLSELGSLGGGAGVRYVRTPSVVVSDYSDDITACGISMEEMEYFRLQRARGQRRCSLEASAAAAGSIGGAKDEAQSDVSAASSCSNLYYCGSTISALDGGECIVNGVRVALARKSSSHSSSGGDLSAGDECDDVDVDVDVDVDDVDVDVDVDVDELDRQAALQQRQRELEREKERERERQLSELLAATQLSDGFKKVGSSSIIGSSSSSGGGGGVDGNDDSGVSKVTFIGNLN